MTRHTRRCWRRTAAWTGAALLLSADAVAVGVRFSQDHSTAVLITAVGLGYGAFLAGCFAIAWCWYTGQAVVHDRGRRPASTGRPQMTAEAIAEHRARAPADEDRHAAAMAAVAEDVPWLERTAAATVPMPVVDATAWLPVPPPYAVRWSFDTAGARTVVPERAGRWAA